MENNEEEKSIAQEILDLTKRFLRYLLNTVKIEEHDSPRTKMLKKVLNIPLTIFVICISPIVLLILSIAVATAL